MKRSHSIALAACLALCLTAPLMSSAALPGPHSDQNLRWARNRVERDLDQLMRDQKDYGGHRGKAIADFQAARHQLLMGLGYDNGRDYVPNALMNSNSRVNPTENPCGRSDVNLISVRRDVEHVIDVLQHDNGDYGGHRVAAISDLQQGREQIVLAIQWDSTH